MPIFHEDIPVHPFRQPDTVDQQIVGIFHRGQNIWPGYAALEWSGDFIPADTYVRGSVPGQFHLPVPTGGQQPWIYNDVIIDIVGPTSGSFTAAVGRTSRNFLFPSFNYVSHDTDTYTVSVSASVTDDDGHTVTLVETFIVTVPVTVRFTGDAIFPRDSYNPFETIGALTLPDAEHGTAPYVFSVMVSDGTDTVTAVVDQTTRAFDFPTFMERGPVTYTVTGEVTDADGNAAVAIDTATRVMFLSRDTSKDFNLDVNGGNISPRGLVKRGTTTWTADPSANKLFAYGVNGARLAGEDYDLYDAYGTRISAKDVTVSSAMDNITGSSDTIWVAVSANLAEAYSKTTFARVPSKNVTFASSFNNIAEYTYSFRPHGQFGVITRAADFTINTVARIATNGSTMWVLAIGTVRYWSLVSQNPDTFEYQQTMANAMVAYNIESSLREPDNDQVHYFFDYDSSTRTTNPQGVPNFSFSSRNGRDIFADDNHIYLVYSDELYAWNIVGGQRVYRLNNIGGIAGHSNGSILWIVDSSNIALAYSFEGNSNLIRMEIADITFTSGSDFSGIWGDTDTVYVADNDDNTIYAYRIDSGNLGLSTSTLGTPLSNEDFNTLADAGNHAPRGMWSDGETLWVVDFDDDKIYGYDFISKARDASKDFDTLSAAGNGGPGSIWSNGKFMWIVDGPDDKIYAYDMTTKAHTPSQDFNTLAAAGNTTPTGIWGNETTVWITDSLQDELYAYDIITKARTSTLDFTSLNAAGNESPFDIWSDGHTMWVVDSGDDKIYSYVLATREYLGSRDFDTIPANPYSIWSNDTTFLILDSFDDKIYAYEVGETFSGPSGVWIDRGDTMFVIDNEDDSTYAYDFDTTDYNSTLDFALSPDNGDGAGITGYGSYVYVADEQDGFIYAYERLGHAQISAGDYSANLTRPRAVYADGRTMYVIDGNHLKGFDMFTKELIVDVSDDGLFMCSGNLYPTGMAVDGTTLLVIDAGAEKVFAYTASGGRIAPWNYFISNVNTEFAVSFKFNETGTTQNGYDNRNDTGELWKVFPADSYNGTTELYRAQSVFVSGSKLNFNHYGGPAFSTAMTNLPNNSAIYLINETTGEYVIFNADAGRASGFNWVNISSSGWQIEATNVSDISAWMNDIAGHLGHDYLFAISSNDQFRPYS